MHVDDVGLGQDLVGESAGRDDQCLGAKLSFHSIDQTFDQTDVAIPWLDKKHLRFVFG